ncbi:MAG: response regulator [Deltaproteobacteria bacterium]|nr:response regulator [Deltaproteobacteria bacterium]
MSIVGVLTERRVDESNDGVAEGARARTVELERVLFGDGVEPSIRRLEAPCLIAPPCAIVVDPDPGRRSDLVAVCAQLGFGVREAGDAGTLLEIARAEPPALVLADLALPDRLAADALLELQSSIAPGVKVLALADVRTPQDLVLAETLGWLGVWERSQGLDAVASLLDALRKDIE